MLAVPGTDKTMKASTLYDLQILIKFNILRVRKYYLSKYLTFNSIKIEEHFLAVHKQSSRVLSGSSNANLYGNTQIVAINLILGLNPLF